MTEFDHSTESVLAYCREHFEYRDDGFLYWLKPPKNHPRLLGQRAGTLASRGYWQIDIYRRKYRVHQLVWLIHRGQWPAEQLDHIDQNRQNNRIGNLREATNAQNGQNRSIRKDNKSGTTGVCFRSGFKNPYQVRLNKDGIEVFQRCYATKEEAIAARKQAEQEHFTHSPANTK